VGKVSNEENDKTNMAFEALIDDAKKRGVIDQEGGYKLKRRFRINSESGRIVMSIKQKVIKYPFTAALTLASGSGGAAYFFDLFNTVD